MAIVFPASPSTNDTFTAGSITYKWDGAKWIGLGVTPTDRLIEGSNSLEITAGNELIWTGGKVGVNQVTPIAILHAKSGANDGTLVSTFEGATNNKLNIRFDTFGPVLDVTAGDPLAFEIGGSEKMRLDGSGRLLINTDDSTTVWGYGDGSLQLMGDYQGASASFINNEANTNSHAITLAKTRNGSILQNGDTFGAIVFSGDDSNGYHAAARIIANVDGTPSDNVMPGRLSFQTGGTGGGSPIERLRINSDGHLTIPYQPRFFAYGTSSSPQTTSGSFTWDTFTTTRFNVGSHFSTTTKVFTAPTAGCYAFGCNCRIDSGDIGYFRVILSVNGSNNDNQQGHSIRNTDTGSAAFHTQSVTALYELNAGDTVKVLVESNGDSSWVMQSESQFWGYMVG